ADFMQKTDKKIIRPTVEGLAKEGLEYHGFIFFGLMNIDGEPFVIEYNCRLGDPETEVVLPRLQTDLVALFAAMDNGTLEDANISFDERSAATIMAVSGGYPGDYAKGKPIELPAASEVPKDTIVFHAGTISSGEQVLTNGGRVLAVTSYGANIAEAVERSKTTLQQISFEGMYFRKDIGFEFPC
ncbi:MAG: phosphoribosylglycinamide synthetase C domain-containing protein, partial [Sediminibacterium sp.]|nr:phosphoribosylglycinamide synthetase C domain-containing protein [Sediminibacterium sp.]